MPSDSQIDQRFLGLLLRIRSNSDPVVWDELLNLVLPDVWRVAIKILGDSDPVAVGRLVGTTLITIGARLHEFRPAENNPGVYAAFREWWQSLMQPAQRRGQPESVAEPEGWRSFQPQDNRQHW